MNLGKLKRVRVKCFICSRVAVLDRATVRNTWLVYECVYCKIKFRVPKNWRDMIYAKGGS
jgi:uncharacterized protein YlaI